MLLPGSLRSTTLGDVLGRLHRAKISGVLELISTEAPYAGRRHAISLRQGLVDGVDTAYPTLPIGELLLRSGRISRSQHALFLEQLRTRQRCRAGELLVELHLVKAPWLSEGLRCQVRERLEAVFEVRQADLRFRPPLAVPADGARPACLEASEFLAGRQRARDRHRAEPTTPRARALAVLGLDERASIEAIRRRFRQRAVQCHPDLHGDATGEMKEQLQAGFIELVGAYRRLVG